jgi:tetratricopeptide (TPR) repeat protein
MAMSRKKIVIASILLVCVAAVTAVAIYQLSPGRRLNRHIVKARISSNGGQYGNALTEYEKALAINPTHAEALCELGFVRLALEQPDRAADQFDKCIKLYPNNQKAWLGIVRARLAQKDIPGATEASETLLKLSRDGDSLQACAEICIARRAFDEALKNYNESIALKPTDYEPVRRAARLLRQLKRDQEARQLLLAFTGRPDANDREKAHLALSEISLAADKLTESLMHLNRAVEIKSSPDALMHRGEVLVMLNQFDQAQQDAEAVFKEQPSPPPLAYKIRAACYLHREDTDSALRDALVAQRSLTEDPQIALLLARIYYKTKSINQAEQEARRALVLSPDYFPAQNFLMSMLIDRGNYDQAIAFGRDLSRRVRRNEAAMRLWIRACFEAKRPEEAQKALEATRSGASRDGVGFNAGNVAMIDAANSVDEVIENLLKLDPKDLDTPTNQYLLGQSYLRAKKLPEAMRALERSAQLDPGRAETLTTLAGVHLALGNSEMGANLLKSIIEKHPESARAIEWLARIYMQQRNYKEADALYGRLTVLDGNSLAPLMNQIKAKLLARDTSGLTELAERLEKSDSPDMKSLSFLVQGVLAHSRDPKTAWEFVDKAVAASPAFGPALHEKAINCIHDGKYDEAIALFQRMESATVKASGTPRLDFGTALLLAGKNDQARSVALEEHLLLKTQESLMLLVAAKLKNGDSAGAREHIRLMNRASELQTLTALLDLPNAAAIFEKMALADAYARAGRSLWAAKAFSEAIALAPESPDLAAIRANVMIRNGKPNEAIELLTELSTKHPKRTDLLLLLADLHQTQKSNDQAIEAFKQVLNIKKDHPRALTAIGTLYLQRGDHSAAANYLQEAVKQSPEDIVALNNFVWVIAVEQKSPQRAMPYAEDLLRLAPHNARTLDTAGYTFLLNNELQKAEQALSYAATLAPDDPDVAHHYAIALSRNNKREKALAELQRAKALKKPFKDTKEAEQLMRELERNPLATGE